MQSGSRAAICCLLSVSVAFLPTEDAYAGPISTEAAVSAGSVSPRVAITTFLKRPEVFSQLQALGVDARMAQERIAAMSDDEVATLVSNLPRLPAGGQMYPGGGGGGGGGSGGGGGYGGSGGGGVLVILLIVSLLVGLFWWLFRGTGANEAPAVEAAPAPAESSPAPSTNQ